MNSPNRTSPNQQMKLLGLLREHAFREYREGNPFAFQRTGGMVPVNNPSESQHRSIDSTI